MEFNELMIGDYVRYIGTGYCDVKNGDIVKVYALQYPRYVGIGDNCMADDELFEPIPLTAEILEANGWIEWKANKMGVVIFTQHFEFSDNLLGIEDSIESRIDCDPYGDFHYMCNGKSLCYINSVHELQHALRLCGIDKTIEL